MMKPPAVKLFASDLDGTLLGVGSQLSNETVAALAEARAAGVPIVAATGRGPHSAVPRLAPCGLIDFAVCSNGALIHDVRTDAPLKSFPIPAELFDSFLHTISGAMPEVALSWELTDGYGWTDPFDFIADGHEDLFGRRRGAAPDSTLPVTKMMAYHPELEPLALADALRSAGVTDLTLSTSGVSFVELTAPGVTKAAALAVLCDEWGIDAADVVAYGDNHNDVSMLEWAGTGVAVGNTHPLAVAAADEVIGRNTDHSVADDMRRRLTGVG